MEGLAAENLTRRLAVLSAHLSASVDSSASTPIIETSSVSAQTFVAPNPNSKRSSSIVDERSGKKHQVQVTEDGTVKATDLKKLAGSSSVRLDLELMSYAQQCPMDSELMAYAQLCRSITEQEKRIEVLLEEQPIESMTNAQLRHALREHRKLIALFQVGEIRGRKFRMRLMKEAAAAKEKYKKEKEEIEERMKELEEKKKAFKEKMNEKLGYDVRMLIQHHDPDVPEEELDNFIRLVRALAYEGDLSEGVARFLGYFMASRRNERIEAREKERNLLGEVEELE